MFWLPQISRAARTGRHSALTTEYLVGMTICRLLFAFCLYLTKLRFFRLTCVHPDYLGYSENILEISPRRECHFAAVFFWSLINCAVAWIWTFGEWVALQVLFIQLQDFYGPAFFLPTRVSTWHTCPVSLMYSWWIRSSRRPRRTITILPCDFPTPNLRTALWEIARFAWMRSLSIHLQGRKGPRHPKKQPGQARLKVIRVESSMPYIGMWSERQILGRVIVWLRVTIFS